MAVVAMNCVHNFGFQSSEPNQLVGSITLANEAATMHLRLFTRRRGFSGLKLELLPMLAAS